ncbi:MAG: hypothetical protein E2576_21985 [Alcaligenaceae bacterium]|nr:hypothetical protein [Alcaligenaceae bacterium SAGV5]MPS51060.1 hypothetical protein [Alcaligenaceae bacterium SAGV3]MPT59398.1 hypothetical protein [Alcaligenaceae bacterium]
MMKLPFFPPRAARLAAAACLALALGACGGDGGGTSSGGTTPPAPKTDTLSGTAATGAAVANATVTVVNAAGASATGKSGGDGRYSITIESAPPYLLKVSTGSGTVLYSFAAAAGTANITPLTTLALHDAGGKKPLAALFEGWKTTRLAGDAVTAAAKRVNANFAALYTAKGVDPKAFDFFSRTFAADGKGFDAVLDGVSVSLSCSTTSCSETIKVGESVYTYDFSISVAGISFSGGGTTSTIPSGSKWELTVRGSANGAPFEQTIGNIEFGAVPASADGAQQVVQQYGGISGGVSGPGVSLNYSYSDLSTSYEGCGSCGVGSTIVLKSKGSVSVSGTASGITIPPTTTRFDYTYTYKRTS